MTLKIISIDSARGTMIIDWGSVMLNHFIPLSILENPSMPQDEMLAAIESMRPASLPEVQVPHSLLDLVEPPAPRVLTSDDVDAERDRRLLRFQFGGNWFQNRPSDNRRITGAAANALAVLITGASWPEDFAWIAEDDTRVPMTATEVITFARAAEAHERGLIFAGNDLKKMVPIPSDYSDDKWWPV